MLLHALNPPCFSDAIDAFIEYSSMLVEPIKHELYNYGYWRTLRICSEACPMAFKEPPFEHHNDVEDK